MPAEFIKSLLKESDNDESYYDLIISHGISKFITNIF